MSTPSTPVSSSILSVLSPNQNNLTGSARKKRDRVIALVNLIEKWKGQQLKGMEVIRKIADKLPKSGEMTLKERYVLETFATELHQIVKSMEDLTNEIEGISLLMNSTLKLELNDKSSETRCSLSHTCEYIEKLSQMFKKDLEVKQLVITDICSIPEFSKMKKVYNAAGNREIVVGANPPRAKQWQDRFAGWHLTIECAIGLLSGPSFVQIICPFH